MLGRKTYTREELDSATGATQEQIAAYRALPASPERDGFEPLFFNHLTLALDRRFVHRLRVSTGKDGNALNEVELIVESLMNNDGVFRDNNVIKYVPEQSVVKLKPGDKIRLTADDFERLSAAFFQDLERKYVP
jgi:hypothetical protein